MGLTRRSSSWSGSPMEIRWRSTRTLNFPSFRLSQKKVEFAANKRDTKLVGCFLLVRYSYGILYFHILLSLSLHCLQCSWCVRASVHFEIKIHTCLPSQSWQAKGTLYRILSKKESNIFDKYFPRNSFIHVTLFRIYGKYILVLNDVI